MVVSVPTYNSADPGSNPTDVNNFSVKLVFEKNKKDKRSPGLANF